MSSLYTRFILLWLQTAQTSDKPFVRVVVALLRSSLRGLRLFRAAELVDRPVGAVSPHTHRLRWWHLPEHVFQRVDVVADMAQPDCRVDVAPKAGVAGPLAERPVLRQFDSVADLFVLIEHGLVEGVEVVFVLERRHRCSLRQRLEYAPMNGHKPRREKLDLDRRVVKGVDYWLAVHVPGRRVSLVLLAADVDAADDVVFHRQLAELLRVLYGEANDIGVNREVNVTVALLKEPGCRNAPGPVDQRVANLRPVDVARLPQDGH